MSASLWPAGVSTGRFARSGIEQKLPNGLNKIPQEGTSMTKADIVDRIFEKVGLTKKESVDVVEELFGLIKDTLEAGEKIKIAGFGNFEVKEKNDRRGRNPQTGEEITIEARRILTFKASAVLKQAVNAEP